jgi:DNA-directed RNA polymerase specialized sigma24 family protein
LRHWTEAGQRALDELVPPVYQELRRLARYHLQAERAEHTLQSTAVVYLRLFPARPRLKDGNRISPDD